MQTDTLLKEVRQPDTMDIDQLPGPDGIPVLGNLLQLTPSKLHRIFEKWSDRYGTIFRIKLGAATVVVITDPDAIQFVLKNRPDKFRRLTKMDDIIREIGFSGVFNAEGEEWKHQRRLVSQALNVNHLISFFPTLVSITGNLLHRWNGLANGQTIIEIKEELMRYTVDVTSRLAFGYNMDTIGKKTDIIQEHLENFFPAIYKRITFPIPYWRFFKLPSDRRAEKSLQAVVKTIHAIIEETRDQLNQNPALRNNPANFLQTLIADSSQEGPVSNQMVIGNVLSMLLAGEDTTAHTLTWIFYFMHVYPEVQQKMQREVDFVLGDNSALMNYEETTSLPYLEAVAFEAMRLKPVAPLMFFDALEDVIINRIKVPKNTSVFLQTQYPATHETHFSDPDKFIPERWIAGGCPHLKAHNEKAFLPFGAGPRFCPGYNLAMIEMKAVLAMVSKNFSVIMETKPGDVTEVMAFTMMPTSFYIKLVSRK